MMDRRVLPLMFLAAMWAAVPGHARAQPSAGADVAPSATDAVLDPPFKSSTEGIEFRPPAGGILSRQLRSGEIVSFHYPDKAWTLALKSVVNSTRMPLVGNPAVPGQQGLLDVAAAQFTERGGEPAKVVRQEPVDVGPRKVGLLEVRDSVGIDKAFIQLALVPDGSRYFILQMVAKGDVPEDAARQAFQRSLATVDVHSTLPFRQEQERRLANTRWLWMQLTEQRVAAALQPVHFMRVVRDGHDVGYVQVNERREAHHGQDGVYVVSRQHVETQPAVAAPTAAPPVPTTPGLDVPRPAVAAVARPTQLDRDARFFVTYDRRHEDWTTIDRLDNRPNNDAMELGNSDVEVHRMLDPAAVRQQARIRQPGDDPPVIDREVDTVRVDAFRAGTRSAPTVEIRVPPSYLPQAMAQVLPRLLPIDQPKQYLFAFYVPEQRQVLYRYVDVGVEQAAELDGRPIRAVPIADRVGADGVVTTHYVTRDDGQWLGSVTDGGKLQVLPTDESTLQSLWKGFAVLPDPPAPAEDEAPRHPARPAEPRGQAIQGPTQPNDPSQFLPSRLDSGTFGGR